MAVKEVMSHVLKVFCLLVTLEFIYLLKLKLGALIFCFSHTSKLCDC